MTDDELIRIAHFKLKEAAKRLADLGKQAISPDVSARLIALAAQIQSFERKLRETD